MNGEELSDESRAFAHIVTGANAGTTYELPCLGKAAWENSVANPYTGDKTLVGLDNDGTDGQVYFYIGTKTNTGTEIDKAGLNNGKPWGVKVAGYPVERTSTASNIALPSPGTRFSLVNLGNVKNMTGAAFNTRSNDSGVTKFSHPEDGAWDPSNPRDYYFNTTDQIDQLNDGVGTQVGRSRVWRLRFDDITNPEKGGTIEAVLDGTEGQNMLDNMTIDNSGHILLQEDVGNQQHNGKLWQYTIATDQIKQIAKHDPAKFGDVGVPASSPFNQDEESSGIFDAQSILGPGMFITVDQAHYSITGEIYEGGQIMALYNPETFNSQAEVSVTGAGINIVDGDLTQDATDNTDFGITALGTKNTRSFVIKNNGPGPLNISSIKIAGNNANEFTLGTALSYPVVLASGATQTINVNFTPLATGNRVANIQIFNNDLDEAMFDFSIQGQGAASEINITSNNLTINNGDVTPGTSNNTDFGWADLSGNGVTKTFTIENNGYAILNVYSIQIQGDNAADFSLVGTRSFPITVGAFSTFSITVKFTPSAAGSRFAKIVINNNDLDEGTYEFVIAGNLSTLHNKTVTENNLLKVYPNPSDQTASVVMNLNHSTALNLVVRNIEGKVMQQAELLNTVIGENKFQISTASFPAGLYFIEIIAGKEIYPIKLMVKH
jgi:hypothetical protein